MAKSRRFQTQMETDVRQFRDEAVVSDFYTPLRVIRFGFPVDLHIFCQIFKVAHYWNFRRRSTVEGKKKQIPHISSAACRLGWWFGMTTKSKVQKSRV
jgi:hypothetical protein